MQYKLTAYDLETLLALCRSGNLAAAGERLGVDSSTVFRAIQRIERGLGTALFDRSRSGYTPLDLTLALVAEAEKVESALELARSLTQQNADQVSGTVKLTTTDAILNGLVIPSVKPLLIKHPKLHIEFDTRYQLANLTKRDADIAIRATQNPPQHLIGKHLGSVQVAVFCAKDWGLNRIEEALEQHVPWIAPDDALPEHPSVLWRKKRFPKVAPSYKVDSILSVYEAVKRGLGIGVLPLFLAQQDHSLIALTEVITEAQTELWLLTHPESRHLVRVATLYRHLAESIDLS